VLLKHVDAIGHKAAAHDVATVGVDRRQRGARAVATHERITAGTAGPWGKPESSSRPISMAASVIASLRGGLIGKTTSADHGTMVGASLRPHRRRI
jgi:hypothetical protein